MNRKQLAVLLILLIVYAACAFLTYAFFAEQLAATAGMPMPETGMSNTTLGLLNAGIVLVIYGILGLAGFWFARKLDLPRIFRADAGWRGWFLIPLIVGLICGVFVVLVDLLFAPINGFGRLVHPAFPLSIVASISAGIGEEILFRGFMFGLWGFILNWIFKRFQGRSAALWIANVIAALTFAASHLGTLLVITHTSSLAELNPILIIEIFVLNGVIGLVAGQRYMKDGLVAAMGVHFWADIVFHVMWGIF